MNANRTQLGLYSPDHEHDACGIGFIAHMKGKKSHDIIEKALLTLNNLEHRGACGCEENTGDGAGILMQVPHDFLVKETKKLGFELPAAGRYGVGIVFMPQDTISQDKGAALLEKIVREQGQVFLGWREVPFDDSMIGNTAKKAMPSFKQVFIGVGPKGPNLPGTLSEAFERRLFVIRKTFENEIKKTDLTNADEFYIPSLSANTLIYKGMLISHQLGDFFPDLKNPELTTALAVVHSRFSTNTFPMWKLAHPFRFISHNGEINTVRGNVNWCRAREALFETPVLGDELKKVLPVVTEGNSDSASFDNMLEMLVMGGYSLPHAVMMMIPEAWSGHESMPQYKKDFYEYHSCLMEPWDGPASVAFTDGKNIGAILDRNGLRPSRYYVTKDDLVIMASEVGVLDIPPENVIIKGRLQPGRMFLVNLEEGRIIDDAEIKKTLCEAKPYAQWLKDNLVYLHDLPKAQSLPEPDHDTVTRRQISFGYTQEDIRIVMSPMALNGEEALGSMGNDAPLAVLAEKPQNLFSYFKQLFAQVTNPPLDALREELVTSVDTSIGPEKNLLNPTEKSAHQIKLKNPILDNDELGRLKRLEQSPIDGFKTRTIPMIFDASEGLSGMQKAIDTLFSEADRAVEEGVTILIISDRGVNEKMAAIPSLLATAGLHHHLVRNGTRTRVGLVIETGEPREVHHFALLVGYGAGAINPYLAFETFDDLIRDGQLNGIDHAKAVNNYTKAVKKGIVKVMSKMGISTIQSYRGAQIFEAIGLNHELIDRYFTHTASRIGGIGLDIVCSETLKRHARAYPQRVSANPSLDVGGEYQWRRDGVGHVLNPDTVGLLQYATRHNKYNVFKQYTQLVDNQNKDLYTLRGLFKFKKSKSIPLDEVEPIESIFKRFKTGAMSYGSISAEAHETLAIAMNRLGGKSNTGEGGEDIRRFKPDANGDLRRSAIKQVASGRFGVTSHYLVEADEIQIKIAQGAKPGEGGQLPGHKVYPWVAKVRLSTPGVGLISPPPHHDIYSIEDLAQLIFDLKNANKNAGISVKLVSEVGVGTVAAGVAKAHADLVLISGYDGGTGASPLTSLKHAGIPWELGLAETQHTLVRNDLRGRIRVEVDGQMKTGRDVVIGALLGGEEYGFATAPLITMGCIMMRVCHLDTCPVGVATQNPELRNKFSGKPEYVENFFKFIAQEVREIMAELGFRTIDEMVGRSDLLDFNEALTHYKSKGLDYSAIFHKPWVGSEIAVRKIQNQDHGMDKVLDNELIKKASDALTGQKKVSFEMPIKNTNRTTGTMLGSEVTKRFGGNGLPEDTIQIKFNGSAGQSFGAFMPKGMTLILDGDANDYVGKGLSGGKIVVYPPHASPFKAEENILIGNVVLYGATSGEAYFRGIAGERFCVRNSGAQAVVEGVGDHGCEYMTGGRVIILGGTGRNFGAGMSGGVAYIYNPKGDFEGRCNKDMVDIDILDDEDRQYLEKMINNHAKYTQSSVAKDILKNFNTASASFVKVMPRDYKKALVAIKKKMQELGVSEKEAMYG